MFRPYEGTTTFTGRDGCRTLLVLSGGMNQRQARTLLCGHCGLRHDSISQVRACSVQQPDVQRSGSQQSTDQQLTDQQLTDQQHGEPDWDRLAGPEVLGRSLVTASGAEVPLAWAHVAHVVVNAKSSADHTCLADVLTNLQDAYSQRRRVVIEIVGLLLEPEPSIEWTLDDLDTSVDLPGDRLDHLIFSNSIDARDPAAPLSRMVGLAIAAGAHPAPPGQPGDVVSPSGEPLWCDGGPSQAFPSESTGGTAVIPRVHLASGILRPLMSRISAADLAADQLQAVDSRHGAARIIAPAGSGKTRVLTERARHLIHDLQVDPSTICLLAFNVRARQEMQQRTTDLSGLEIRTLNSLALAIVRGTGPFRRPASPTWTVIDEHRVRHHLRDLVKTRRRAMTDPFAAWIEAFTACRLGLRDAEDVEREFDGDVKGLPRVLVDYRTRLSQLGEIDFDEQIIRAIEVLATQPHCRRVARAVCGVMLVDEFQDLTPAHLLLLRLLAGPAAEVFGVGDDDQTIYGYAGASPSWLIDFSNWFPGADSHLLHINYRCAPEVVDAATNLLSHNRHRVPKLISARPERASTEIDRDDALHPLRRIQADDELGALCDAVAAMIDLGTKPREIAVLTRVNATLLAPMLALRAAGVATTTPVDSAYLSRTGVAASLAWLRLATCPDTDLPTDALVTAARRPPRGLSPMVLEWMAEQHSVDRIQRLANRLRNERDQVKVSEFADQLALLRRHAAQGADTVSILTAVSDTIGLGNALETRLDASRRSLDRSSHGDDLAALISVAHLQPEPSEFPKWLSAQLQGRKDFDTGGISLSTVHRVKGMEWPRVIVYGVNEGLCPHRLATDIEEERRIFHVAITRSIEQSVVIAGRDPSRFLAEIEEESPPLSDPEPPVRPPTDGPNPPHNSLFEALRVWRSGIAHEAGVPAYIVFDNRTLEAIAQARPSDDAALLAVSGVGPVKLERYGHDVLEIVGKDH